MASSVASTSSSTLPHQSPTTAASKSALLSSYFLAGGVAGATSRTIVSPLERLKIIMQVQPPPSRSAATCLSKGTRGGRGVREYEGTWKGLARIWKEEGMRGMLRGNGINCLRIFPYSAVQFSTYETLKTLLTNPVTNDPLTTPQRLFAGAISGIASVSVTYPLDLVRSRISICTASFGMHSAGVAGGSAKVTGGAWSTAVPLGTRGASSLSALPPTTRQVPTIIEMTHLVYNQEGGIRGLYRGLVPTCVGVGPYVGVSFATYEALKSVVEEQHSLGRGIFWDGSDGLGAVEKLSCGGIAGGFAQGITFPLDVLRRKMQVAGMPSSSKSASISPKYTSSLNAISSIVKNEGVRGLYRGLGPNLLKVGPSIAVSFFTYETVKEFVLSQ